MFLNPIRVCCALFFPAVFAIQYANYFKVDPHDYKGIRLKSVLYDMCKNTFDDVRVVANDKISYTINDQTYSDSFDVVIRKLMVLAYTDMQVYVVSEIDRVVRIKGDQIGGVKKSCVLKHVDAMFPGCNSIPHVLDYLYNRDVDFEDLLGSFYALCIVPRNFVEHYYGSPGYESNRTNNAYTRLRSFLLDRFGRAFAYQAYSPEEIARARAKMDRWNGYLDELSQKFRKHASNVWIVPERLTYTFLMQSNLIGYNKHVKMLLQSPVQVNGIYKRAPADKRGLQQVYRDTACMDSDPATLLAYYDTVLEKMNDIFDMFLYRHLLIFHLDVQSVDSVGPPMVEAMNSIANYCNWEVTFQRFRDLLVSLKHTFVRTFGQNRLEQCVMGNMLSDNRLKKIDLPGAPTVRAVLSNLLNLFPSNINPEMILTREISSHTFTFVPGRTEKLIKQNYLEATIYVNELILVFSRNITIQYAIPFLKKFLDNLKLRFEATLNCF